MKRYRIIKEFIKGLKDNDVAIFTGKEMCKEAYQYDRPGNFYIENHYGIAAPFALGVAMGSDKRIFVFIGEGDFLREFSIASQISASVCENIFLVILDNGVYQSIANFPNIMSSMRSKRGVMFNLGLTVFDFNVYLKHREFDKMRTFITNLQGPVVVFFDVEIGIKKNLPEIDISEENLKQRLMEFIANKELGTSVREKITGPILNIEDVNPEVLDDLRKHNST